MYASESSEEQAVQRPAKVQPDEAVADLVRKPSHVECLAFLLFTIGYKRFITNHFKIQRHEAKADLKLYQGRELPLPRPWSLPLH